MQDPDCSFARRDKMTIEGQEGTNHLPAHRLDRITTFLEDAAFVGQAALAHLDHSKTDV